MTGAPRRATRLGYGPRTAALAVALGAVAVAAGVAAAPAAGAASRTASAGASGASGAAVPGIESPSAATPQVATAQRVSATSGATAACQATAAEATAPGPTAATSTTTTSRPVDRIKCTWQRTLADPTHPIAWSSPTVATVGATPAVVLGDRLGDLYALDLATGKTAWKRPTHVVTPGTGESPVPIDSSPSVGPTGDIFVGAGNGTAGKVDLPAGGYYAFSPAGDELWHTSVVDPPTDAGPANAVTAGLTVATLAGTESVAAGSLDQEGYALDATNGTVDAGWPFFDSDSVFSTAAEADLYGTGSEELIEGASQTAGFGQGQLYKTGGHLRILSAQGDEVCHYDSTQSINSSPAVGDFLAGGAPGIVVGTGDTFPGAAQSDAVLAFDDECQLEWQATLNGVTWSSPALADVTGTGQLRVVEGTGGPTLDKPSTGTAYVLNAATGAVVWKVTVPDKIIGSIVTADLTGGAFEDLLVPTEEGVYIISGTKRTHAVLAVLDGPGTRTTSTTKPRLTVLGPYTLGFQNSPLVTMDPDGDIGITVAGYGGGGAGAGYVTHFEVPATGGVSAVGPGTWPEFHHDPELSGDAQGPGADAPTTPACQIPSAVADGYYLVGADSGVYSFGSPYCGATATHPLDAPIVGAASAPGTGGYWLVAADGGVFAYGGAGFYGSMGGQALDAPIVAMAATPDGKGYWLVGADGGIFAFGDAAFYGSMGGRSLDAPIVGIAATADGLGYRLVASDGGIFDFGQTTRTQYFGSMGGQALNAPIVGMADDQLTGGYWLVAADGGVFSFNAPFLGSTGAITLDAPIVGMSATQNGYGYRFVGSDGGVFCFGTAAYDGSEGGQPINAPIVAITD